LKIAFISPSISRALGGIFEAERRQAQALTNIAETSVEILSLEDEYTQVDLPQWLPLQPRYFPSSGQPSSFRYSSRLEKAVLASDADLLHLQALWTHNSVIVNKWTKRWKRPYLITPNGMLEPWAVRNSGWKKRLALALYERKCLSGAACIHVSSQNECDSVREFGLRNPICVIPNGVDIPHQTEETEAPWKHQIAPDHKVLLFLGRLHPKKGLVNLLRAWSEGIVNKKNTTPPWTLAIAGWDQNGHEDELKNVASSLQLNSSVIFLGPRFGKEKLACYQNCDAFVLPSFSEGVPIAVLEAWSHSKPVLMTPGCNLPIGFTSNAALKIEPTVSGVAGGVEKLLSMSDSERESMGMSGFSLAKDRFSWSKIAADIRSVYSWILDAGPKPSCVVD